MMMASDNELHKQARVLSDLYENDQPIDFPVQLNSFKTTLKLHVQTLDSILQFKILLFLV